MKEKQKLCIHAVTSYRLYLRAFVFAESGFKTEAFVVQPTVLARPFFLFSNTKRSPSVYKATRYVEEFSDF